MTEAQRAISSSESKQEGQYRANILVYAEGIIANRCAGHFRATRANIDVGEQVPVRVCHDVALGSIT
jgi:hypothetical protein